MTTDREIRAALHQKRLKRLHASPDTIVIDELGLAHANVIVDIAVINGTLDGFEIKSAQDSLARLPKQLMVYERCLERLTIVCDVRHAAAVKRMAPAWAGILQVEKGPRGAVRFRSVRPALRNPNVRPELLAHLLWRPEAIALLTQLDVAGAELRRPRKALYEHIAQKMTTAEITASIRSFMKVRQAWRSRSAHT